MQDTRIYISLTLAFKMSIQKFLVGQMSRVGETEDAAFTLFMVHASFPDFV